MSSKSDQRQSERSHVAERQEVVINGTIFRLNDIGLEGFGVIVENEHALFLGQRLTGIELKTADRSKTLKGIVSHITKTRRHTICGIRFEFGGPEDLKFVTAFKKAIAG